MRRQSGAGREPCVLPSSWAAPPRRASSSTKVEPELGSIAAAAFRAASCATAMATAAASAAGLGRGGGVRRPGRGWPPPGGLARRPLSVLSRVGELRERGSPRAPRGEKRLSANQRGVMVGSSCQFNGRRRGRIGSCSG
jgi:hypothetical protein